MTSVAGLVCLLSGVVVSRYASPLLWLVLIGLSNLLPVTLFFCCRGKMRFFAFGLIGGSFVGCALHLMYAVAAWQEAIATAPHLG